MSKIINLSDTDPAPSAGYVNVKWQENPVAAGTDPTTGYPYFDVSAQVPISVATVPLAPSVGGPFTVAHSLGHTPTSAVIQMTSNGTIWFQIPQYDATNLYLVASDGPLTGNAVIFP